VAAPAPPPPDDCASARDRLLAQAGVAVPRDDDPDRFIYALSPRGEEALRDSLGRMNLRDFDRFLESQGLRWEEIKARHPNLSPDEVDVRFELNVGPGGGEIAVTRDDQGRVVPSELVLKYKGGGVIEGPRVGTAPLRAPGMEIGIGLEPGDPDDPMASPRWNGRLKFGFALEREVQSTPTWPCRRRSSGSARACAAAAKPPTAPARRTRRRRRRRRSRPRPASRQNPTPMRSRYGISRCTVEGTGDPGAVSVLGSGPRSGGVRSGFAIRVSGFDTSRR
jgi:hypothetical protein